MRFCRQNSSKGMLLTYQYNDRIQHFSGADDQRPRAHFRSRQIQVASNLFSNFLAGEVRIVSCPTSQGTSTVHAITCIPVIVSTDGVQKDHGS